MENYKEQFKLLNKQQREAVETVEGPVLVVAGPGTGKTQLLSMRVANILQSTDTDPGSILCLTFTNKAATNMKDRLMRLAGPAARKVQVKTFHSFAAEIMNQYPDYFWNGAQLTTAPETTQLEIIQSILEKLPIKSPLALTFAGKYTSVDSVLKSLKLTKDAGLTPDKLKAIIKANIAYIDVIEPQFIDILSDTLSYKKLPELQKQIDNLPDQPIDELISPLISLKTVLQESLAFAISRDEGTNKATNTSKWKGKWIKSVDGKKGMWDERSRNNWWLELANVYKDYREQLHVRGYYDYSDMLVEVIAQLEQNPELLSDIQERFQYVLIDEFQDSNAAQLRLAHLVADHETANGRPNIMAVGDDDQSIFGFNGAELNNMLFFERNYKDTAEIVLQDNYRSSQSVLDASEKIINQAEDRLTTRRPDLTKKLTAAKEKRTGEILHLRYPTREHQLHEIVKLIQKKRKENKEESIAVLARSHDSLKLLSSLLLKNNIPVGYELRNNILDYEAVKQVLTLAKTVVVIQEGDKTRVNQYLSELLRHPLWKVAPEDLWILAISNQKNGDWLSSMASSKSKRLKEIAKYLHWVSAQATHEPLALIIEYIVGLRPAHPITSPIRNYFAEKREIDNDYLQALSALQLLRQLVNEFALGESPQLKDFVNFIELNQANNRTVADESPFVSDKNAVELYSVHKAKGLEFDNVFIIDAIEDIWKPKSGRRKPPANLPLQPPLENDDDYARLLYVAATRAKHTIIVTSYDFDHANKELLASPLLHGALESQKSPAYDSAVGNIEVLEDALHWPHLSKAKEKELLKARLESFSINVTNLLNFLDVTRGGPDYFFDRNILRLPEAKTTALAHGTATHVALEEAQKLTNSDSFDLKRVEIEYVRALKAEHLPEHEFERYKIHGPKMLTQLFDEFHYELPKDSKPEQRLKDIRLENAVIDGKLDRVDAGEEKLVIVDYKTGKSLGSFDTTNKSQEVKAWRQKTQLIFYALLAQNHPRFSNYKNIEGQMVYIEADLAKNLVRSYAPTQEEIDRLWKLIEAVWAKVKNIDLPDTTKYSDDLGGIIAFENDLLDGKI